MQVTVKVEAGRIGACTDGSSELLWRLLLDRIFVDAEAHGVDRLYVVVPEPRLMAEVERRVTLTDGGGEAGEHTAIAWLNGEFTTLIRADRVYTLAPLLPWRFRQWPLARRAGWRLLDGWFLPTWRARALGAAMRVLGLMRWAYWQDRVLFRIRETFVADTPTWARFVLSIWEPAGRETPSTRYGDGAGF
jgi:hypothetical protein